jgi:hypothetical protein
MVIRVALVVCCLILGLVACVGPNAMAGGPPMCPPPTCAPPMCPPPTCGPPMCPPPTCGPQMCPPRPPSPFSLCGGIVGTCTSICGTCLGIPAMIVRALLAPPKPFPPFPGPCGVAPPCYPACAPPPPCPPPRRITKCRRVSSNSAISPSSGQHTGPRFRTASAPAAQKEARPKNPSVVVAQALSSGMHVARFSLIGGALSSPDASPSPNALADKSVTSGNPTLGRHW